MENKMNMNELEQMREQMQMFRNKIDKQEIINDKLVRCAVKSKMSWIKKYVYFEFCIIPFLALLWEASNICLTFLGSTMPSCS